MDTRLGVHSVFIGGAGMKKLLVILLFCSITINIYQCYQTKEIEADCSEQRKKIVELNSQIEASENSLATTEETLTDLQLTISELENTKEQLMQENVELQKQLEEMSKPENSTSTTKEDTSEAYLAEKMPETTSQTAETPTEQQSQPTQPVQPAQPSQPTGGFKFSQNGSGMTYGGQATVEGSGASTTIKLN